jgi:hypothetical protein
MQESTSTGCGLFPACIWCEGRSTRRRRSLVRAFHAQVAADGRRRQLHSTIRTEWHLDKAEPNRVLPKSRRLESSITCPKPSPPASLPSRPSARSSRPHALGFQSIPSTVPALVAQYPPVNPLYTPCIPLVSPFYRRYRGYTGGLQGD